MLDIREVMPGMARVQPDCGWAHAELDQNGRGGADPSAGDPAPLHEECAVA